MVPRLCMHFTLALVALCPLFPVHAGVVVSAPAERVKANHPAAFAVDGDPSTIWHTPFRPDPAPFPHAFVIDLGQTMNCRGLYVLPRQDGGWNGVINDFAVYVSADSVSWGEPVLEGAFEYEGNPRRLQQVLFDEPVRARYLKLVAKSSVKGDPFSSAAEIAVLNGHGPVPLRRPVICFALYTVHDGVLKLSAQLYPDRVTADTPVLLEVERDGRWVEVARAEPMLPAWNALLRVEKWDSSADVPYRVRVNDESFTGSVRRDPSDRRVVRAAVFTGNSPGPGGGRISKRDVVDNVLKVDPDVLLFTGDQVYDHFRHTQHWLKFGEDFGDLIRDRPTVCIPDDHDVGQPNLWGGGGRQVKVDTEGGYTRPVEYVKMVERQQTSHLPDPYDPAPIEQGIGVYFTTLNIGGIDFAIIEDRKFKSGCHEFDLVGRGFGPRPDHINKDGVDMRQFDLPGKELLGPRQEAFLRTWQKEWKGAVMKCVVSQTLFTMASTHHGSAKTRYVADFDANGWPQGKRNLAVDLLRRCFAFHVCGDQHLATLVQYGIDEWRDSGWAYCCPSIANLWPRWWEPKTPALRTLPGVDRPHTGDYFDGFGNRHTVYAHTNPYTTGREPAEFHDRMPGWGLVEFDKDARTITINSWPRMVDPADPAARQYEGWPRTISQTDNYGRAPAAWLPPVDVEGAVDPVVKVETAGGEMVYILRIKGTAFQPWVFENGDYTVTVGVPESDTWQRVRTNSGPREGRSPLRVVLAQ